MDGKWLFSSPFSFSYLWDQAEIDDYGNYWTKKDRNKEEDILESVSFNFLKYLLLIKVALNLSF